MTRTLLLALTFGFLVTSCDQEPALLRQNRKTMLVRQIGTELLASVAAEKTAVMATTDEDSTAFAEESRKRSGKLALLRDELEALITADGRPGEVEKLAAFDAAWSQLRDVDDRLLALAVANSNLKAAWLAAGDTTVAMDRLLAAVAAIESETGDTNVLRDLSAASVAALRIHVSLAPHIASKDDTEMTRIEERLQALSERVEKTLANAREHAPATSQPHVAEAEAAWADYRRLTADVIRLSRQNTNVISVDVSLHEKRRVTDSCRAALDALLAEIHSGEATR